MVEVPVLAIQWQQCSGACYAYDAPVVVIG
jgi:hypothetical protein